MQSRPAGRGALPPCLPDAKLAVHCCTQERKHAIVSCTTYRKPSRSDTTTRWLSMVELRFQQCNPYTCKKHAHNLLHSGRLRWPSSLHAAVESSVLLR